MGDGIQKKYALIVNGDTETRHLGNVDRAVKALRREGTYEISVASTKAPGTPVEHFEKFDDQGLEQLLSGMSKKMDDDDLLVVYFTGHGGAGEKGDGCVQTSSQCVSLTELSRRLKTLPYGNRILVMDNCFSGSGFSLFADAKTTVVSQGSPGETVSCQLFSPFFWGDSVPDADHDGKISIQERFQHAVAMGQTNSLLQYYSPHPIGLSGDIASRPFKTSDGKPVEVRNGGELATQLKRLKPGQVALVDFGADWCIPCKKYQPTFEKLSKQYDGKFLMIHAKGVQGSEEDWAKYGIKQFPTVAFIDWNGKVVPVQNPDNPEATLAMVAIHSKEDQLRIHLRHLQEGDRIEKIQALRSLKGLGEAGLPALPLLIPLLKSEDADLQYFSVQAIGEIGPMASAAIPALIPLLKDRDFDVLTATIKALGQLGPKAKASLDPLLSLLGSDLEAIAKREVHASNDREKEDMIFGRTRKLQETLSASLVQIGGKSQVTLEAFIAALRDPKGNYWSRRAALQGLAMMGGSAAEAGPTLLSCIPDPRFQKLQPRDTILEIALQSPATMELLAERASRKSEIPFDRFRLLEILNSAGPSAASVAPAIEKIARDDSDDPRIRKYAALTAVKLDPNRAAGLKAILRELENTPILFRSETPAPSSNEPIPRERSKWSWELAAQSNGRAGAFGGGMEASIRYGFGNFFGLRFGLNVSAMDVEDGTPPADFQLGGSIEPTFHLTGKNWQEGLYLHVAGFGLQYLFGNDQISASISPLGLGYQIPLLRETSLDLGAMPLIHYHGELKLGGGGRIGLSSTF